MLKPDKDSTREENLSVSLNNKNRNPKLNVSNLNLTMWKKNHQYDAKLVHN